MSRIFEHDTKDHSDWPIARLSPGQLAYEADCRATPRYHDGAVRKDWQDLCEVARWSWERNPTQR